MQQSVSMSLSGNHRADRRIIAVVPARNEEDCIAGALGALFKQTRPPDWIIVVADNCTDRTAEIAARFPVHVVQTVGNTHRKAGALNFVLGGFLDDCHARDLVLVTDADTVLAPSWIENACRWMDRRPEAGAICTVYRGRQDNGVIPFLQRLDYNQETRRIARRKGKIDVLSGVATMFSCEVLRTVAANRGGALPGRSGDIYDVRSLTEDFELTLAMKTLGYQPISPKDVVAVTEVMLTLSDLRRQRLRWQRGTLETLAEYGWSRLTSRHWVAQTWTYLVSMSLPLMLALMALSWSLGTFSYNPTWLLALPLFYAEHIFLCWKMGWRGRVFAFTIVPFWLYENFRMFVYWSALVKAALRNEKRWA